jgi:3-hydroxyacyl-CoA dehydrogenase/enoyl-CoA hydratase/3-hydroxybutyryl-CoA epimerase
MSVTLTIEHDVGFIEFDQPDSKVNLLTADVIRRFDAILTQVAAAKEINTLVITSRKKDIFMAGADIKEIEKITAPGVGQSKAQAGQDVLNKLEDLEIPTVAVIDGAALGGGCELALACEYRVATFNNKVKIGLPEVNLGFVPGFGGTYRLPRIVGLAEGLRMVLSGKPVDSERALKTGLVDRLYPQQGLAGHIHRFIAEIHEGKVISDKYARRKKKNLAAILEGSLLAQYLTCRQARQSVLKLSKGFYPAPLKAVDLISQSYCLDRGQGMAMEAKVFGELAVTDISKNLVQVFYLSEQYKKLSVDDAPEITPAHVDKCAVVGAGIMGGGIAQLFSHQGIWVRLKDINYAAVAQGLRAAAERYKEAVKRKSLTLSQAAKSMTRISGTLDYSGFAQADVVIEAVIENMDVKKKVFRELSEAVSDRAILATNTSALSVTEMAGETKDPSRVIGLHFFNPVHRMPLVEIVTTPLTSKQTIAATVRLAQRLGKIPILVKDSRGFLVNRVLLAYVNEAGRVYEECGQLVRTDKLMTDFGMPMGPFTLSDEVGLDVGVKVLRVLEEGLGGRFKPARILEEVLAKGLLGKKSGKGFYTHGPIKEPNDEVSRLLGDRRFSCFKREEYLKRMVYTMVNEAARCLEERVVDAAGAVDTGMIFGAGFPAFRGGLLRYADTLGADHIVRELEALSRLLKAERFNPCPYLVDLRDQKKKFYSRSPV